jgi:hypothetical protein
MISGPRNISTAIMYSFGNRSDCHIIDEPLYGYYLKKTGVDHPGRVEIMEDMECDASQVVNNLLESPYNKSYVFLKNMAHHLTELDLSFTLPLKNLFLIRDTEQILRSFAKVIPNPSLEDIGIKQEWEIYNYLVEQGKTPIVVDSGLLLENPESVLRQTCEQLEIPFDNSMLSWEAGPRKADGVWAKYWYKNVHQTTGFKTQESSNITEPLPDSLQNIHREAYIYYEKLLAKAITP